MSKSFKGKFRLQLLEMLKKDIYYMGILNNNKKGGSNLKSQITLFNQCI